MLELDYLFGEVMFIKCEVLFKRGKKLKKEYVITEITAAPDGSPYVLVSLVDPRDLKDRQRSPYGSQVAFSSPDELFRNLGRIFQSQMAAGMSTVIKLGLHEYEELNIKVGDKIFLNIVKAEAENV